MSSVLAMCVVQAEDECVVDAVLSTPAGKSFSVVQALPSWSRRGEPHQSSLTAQQAACCVRVAGAEDGMNGFFVAKLRRGKHTANSAPSVSSSTAAVSGNKRARAPASTPHANDDDDERTQMDDDDEETAPHAASSGASAPLIGTQSVKNKKKREKAKLKRQKLAAHVAVDNTPTA